MSLFAILLLKFTASLSWKTVHHIQLSKKKFQIEMKSINKRQILMTKKRRQASKNYKLFRALFEWEQQTFYQPESVHSLMGNQNVNILSYRKKGKQIEPSSLRFIHRTFLQASWKLSHMLKLRRIFKIGQMMKSLWFQCLVIETCSCGAWSRAK